MRTRRSSRESSHEKCTTTKNKNPTAGEHREWHEHDADAEPQQRVLRAQLVLAEQPEDVADADAGDDDEQDVGAGAHDVCLMA